MDYVNTSARYRMNCCNSKKDRLPGTASDGTGPVDFFEMGNHEQGPPSEVLFHNSEGQETTSARERKLGAPDAGRDARAEVLVRRGLEYALVPAMAERIS
jgi:hypothetical protein